MVRKRTKVTETTKKEDVKKSNPALTEESTAVYGDPGLIDVRKKRKGHNGSQEVVVRESKLHMDDVSVKTKGRKKSKASIDLCQDKAVHEKLDEQSDVNNQRMQQFVNPKDDVCSNGSQENSKQLSSNVTVDHRSSDTNKTYKRNKKADVKEERETVLTRARVQQKKFDHSVEHVYSAVVEQKGDGFSNDKEQLDKTKNVKSNKRKERASSSAVQASRRKKIKSEPEIQECKVDLDKLVTEKQLENDMKVTTRSKKFVGAHVSIAGGLSNAIHETLAIGGRAFGLFLKSQRMWNSKPLQDADAECFKATLKESGISSAMVVPHGSYLLNCGSSDDTVLQKSQAALVDELKRCDKLGLPIYNFHPGSSKGEISTEECIKKIAETINLAHSQTNHVVTVIENMSGQGNTVGGKFSELKAIIDGVKDKSRVGVCLDTCHAFAAGYDIKSEDGYEQMKKEFISVIGHNFLKAVHLNDSKGELGCHQDRHENIGKGKLGLTTFKRIMNDPFFDNIPMILETPEGDYGKEISKLYSLCDN